MTFTDEAHKAEKKLEINDAYKVIGSVQSGRKLSIAYIAVPKTASRALYHFERPASQVEHIKLYMHNYRVFQL